MSEVRRIHVVGGPGSGKTTFARCLSKQLGVPTYDLDLVGYEGGAGAKRLLHTKVDDVQRIAAQPGWITEGVFLWWTEELFLRADVIVWLDLPFRVTAWRILLRHVRAELARDNRHPGWWNLAHFLSNVRRYYESSTIEPRAPDDDGSVTRAATATALEPYRVKVLACRHQADVRRLATSRFEHQEVDS